MIQLDPADAAAREPALRGWVEELESGLSAPFDSAPALVALLERALQAIGAQKEDGGQ